MEDIMHFSLELGRKLQLESIRTNCPQNLARPSEQVVQFLRLAFGLDVSSIQENQIAYLKLRPSLNSSVKALLHSLLSYQKILSQLLLNFFQVLDFLCCT